MGKFDGWLICTDFDGTFAVAGQPVPENLDAVRYFTENGGRFTVATGRTVSFIREKGLGELINAPACLANGSAVYDYKTETLLREVRMPITVAEFLESIKKFPEPILQIHIFLDVEQGNTGFDDASEIPEQYMNIYPQKMLCKFKTEEQADLFKAYGLSNDILNACYISKSWRFGVEFNAPEGTKGHSLDYIRDYLGDIHTAVGVGDFENDLPLLQHADIGAAPVSGLQKIREAAAWILAPAPEGAIRDLIQKMEESI